MRRSTTYYLLPTTYSSRGGFTVLELVIFAALFAIVAVIFITVLVSVVRVQARQGAAAEVNGQSQFLLQTIQSVVEQSSAIEVPADVATTTLKLRMASSAGDPTYVYLQGGVAYLQQTSGGTSQPLTSARVTVSGLTFTRRTNGAGHDSVAVSFTVQNNTQNLQQRFVQLLQTSVARVSAATFDSNLVPNANNTYKIGLAAQDWQSINNTIYFSAGNVGIGVSNPGQTLEINGGIRLNTATVQPVCGVSQRGTFWMTESASGVKDRFEVCAKSATDTYLWATIY